MWHMFLPIPIGDQREHGITVFDVDNGERKILRKGKD